jgi:hypothetical protein
MHSEPGNAAQNTASRMLLVLDNTVMSKFARMGRVSWLSKVWPGKLATSSEAWDELQAGIRLVPC